jgi:CheY-like chemotaxis protein
MMDGAIRVESTPGAGSSFRFDCWLQLGTPGGRAASRAASLEVPHFMGARVLLVEDNDVNQQIAVELLQAAGVAVDVRDDGRQGVEALRAAGPAHYDLVFMDLQMPEMDGHEATRAIRSDPAFAALPIIAMTAHAMAEEREACLKDGMNGLVVKPVHPGTLYGVLREWLASKEVQSEAAPALAPAAASSTETALRTVAGLDVAAGLRGVLGKWPVYEDLLRRFAAGQALAVTATRSALADGDTTIARRLMHTLRGTSGGIGAVELARMAGQAEDLIVRGEAPGKVLAAVDAIEPVLQALLVALMRAVPAQASPPPAAAEVDRESALHAAARLQAMLAEDDAEAVDFIRDNGVALRAVLGEEFAAIERLVGSYALPEASGALREALERDIRAAH